MCPQPRSEAGATRTMLKSCGRIAWYLFKYIFAVASARLALIDEFPPCPDNDQTDGPLHIQLLRCEHEESGPVVHMQTSDVVHRHPAGHVQIQEGSSLSPQGRFQISHLTDSELSEILQKLSRVLFGPVVTEIDVAIDSPCNIR